MAIVDDKLTLGATSVDEAVFGALEGLVGAETSLVTLYYGADTSGASADALAVDLRGHFSDHEVEVVNGGQPHYDYIVSLE